MGAAAAAPLRGALWGLGHMGRHHLRKLQARPDVQVVVVDPEQGHPPPATLDRLDFAVIASPTATHAAVALPLLEAGVACLVEKPLADDLAAARRLAAFPRLSVGHVERYSPALDPVLAELGDRPPAFIEATRLAPWRAPRAGARGTDVDVVADLMMHDLDLVLRLCGPARLDDLRAVGIGVLTGAVDIVDVRLELTGPRGRTVAVLRASRVSPAPVRTLRLFAPGSYWSANLLDRTAHRVDWGGATSAEALRPLPLAVDPAADALERQLDAFLAAVRGERPFPVPGAEAVAALELVEAVRAAL